jgi:hypothetical protein
MSSYLIINYSVIQSLEGILSELVTELLNEV